MDFIDKKTLTLALFFLVGIFLFFSVATPIAEATHLNACKLNYYNNASCSGSPFGGVWVCSAPRSCVDTSSFSFPFSSSNDITGPCLPSPGCGHAPPPPSPPSASITDPAAGTWQNGSFSISYNALNASNCSLETRNGSSASWINRGTVSCGSGRTTTLQIPSWCSTQGLNSCSAKIIAQSGSDTAETERTFSLDTTAPTTSIHTPAAASTQSVDFSVTYTATDANINECRIFTKDGSAAWQDRGAVSCGTNQTKTISLNPWCISTGINACGVRITIEDLAGNTQQAERFFNINQAPQVNAGADQSINFGLPQVTATLSGIVTDDGIPSPFTVQWRLVSGDANKVTITSPDTITTNVDFTGSGTYVFDLEADDTAAVDADQIQIAVQNSPPSVDAGPNRTIDFGFPVLLQGTASDDGLPNPPTPNNLSIQWSGSGPGTVTFTNPTSASTEVKLSQAGVYNLSLQANDGEFTTQSNIEITYGAPTRYGLIPCGVNIDDPATPWNETESCELRHTLLLIRNIIDFTLWKLAPLIIAILAILTGAIFYFSFGGPDTLTRVRTIWSAVGKGVIILLFSWLFLNFFLGVLGFDINIFGRWYEISA